MGQATSSAIIEKVNEEQIRKEIVESPVVIYTKEDCGYCKMAKELLAAERIKFKEHELEQYKRQNGEKEYTRYVNGLCYITRRTSVPQIFICMKFIGGFTELDKLHKNNKLKEEISRCE